MGSNEADSKPIVPGNHLKITSFKENGTRTQRCEISQILTSLSKPNRKTQKCLKKRVSNPTAFIMPYHVTHPNSIFETKRHYASMTISALCLLSAPQSAPTSRHLSLPLFLPSAPSSPLLSSSLPYAFAGSNGDQIYIFKANDHESPHRAVLSVNRHGLLK